MRVYFTGCSGSGKTTLADYVRETYNIPKVPSAARMVLASLGHPNHQDLHQDRTAHMIYQRKVFEKQIELEKQLKNFVSERCIDHFAYAVLYGRYSPYKTYDLTSMQCYIASLLEEGVSVFYVPPTKICHEAALAEGGRQEFLNWNDMVAFDGMIRYILITNEIPHIPVTPIALHDRKQLVTGTLDLMMRCQ